MHIAGKGDPASFEEWRGDTGCLLLHGFPGSPAEVRELGAYLSEREVSVLAPLLPGHGQEPAALRGIRREDWIRSAAAGLRRLQERCSWVFAAGLSMGAALSLYLAAEVPLAGLALVSPAVSIRNPLARLLPVASFFLQWVDIGEDEDLVDPTGVERQWYYTRAPAKTAAEMYRLTRAAWRLAPYVNVPALIIQSPQDAVLHPEGAEALLNRLASKDKTLLWLERSGHNALVDIEREIIFAEVYAFVQRIAQ
jgi:carboxylesterase